MYGIINAQLFAAYSEYFCIFRPESREIAMYKASTSSQIRFDDFNQGCGMQLDKDNEWVRLGDLIPWQKLEYLYSVYFPSKRGRPAYSFRLALGTLIIQNRLGIADRKVVQAITEGPYLQYFLGFPRFQTKAPFSPSLMVEFRKRLNPEIIEKCNDEIIKALQEAERKAKDAAPKKRGRKKADEIPDENGNLGTAILDATCAPSYIRYPQDFSLLNEARVKLEGMIDWFYKTYGFDKKPRTYRRVARKDYLELAKCKKRTASMIRATVRKMLAYVKRDLGYLEGYMSEGYAMVNRKMINTYLVILTLYEQQQYMWDNHVHSVEHRIVSLSQPWIRPIVRGKVKTPTEFGAKFEVILDEHGYARITRMSYEAFNESEGLQDALTRYHERTGRWPKRVLVDQIYRTRANRDFCKEHGIRMSGPKLGRPKKDEKQSKADKKIEYKDNTDRIGVERFFSLGKRCNGMGLIKTRLAETSVTAISLSVLVTNLFRHTASIYFFVFYFTNEIDASESNFALFDFDEDDFGAAAGACEASSAE